jgi:macrolide-specific efflux system membrane fusion protein
VSRLLRAVRRWPVIVGIVIIVLVGGGATAWALTRSSGSSTPTSQTVAAKVATINETVSTSGTIEAAKEADLDFGASGRVTAVKVAVGDKVSKGQTLATVGNTALAAAYDAAKASVSAAQDKVTEDADASSTQLTADKAALTAAKSQRSSARTAFKDADLTATITGTVTSVDLTKGQEVSTSASSASASGAGSSGGGSGALAAATTASSSSSSSDSQVVIQSTDSYLVDATVDDTEVKTVKKGQTVAITPDGATASIAGTVTSVSAVASTSSDVVTFPVVIKVTGHPTGVYAGASATVVITTKHVSKVLEIPTLAITYSGSTATVNVSSGGHTSKRTISAGTTYGLETQVLSGLKSGDKVVVTIPTFGGGRLTRGGTGGTGGGLTGGFGGGTGGFGGATGGAGGFGGGTGGFSGGTSAGTGG